MMRKSDKAQMILLASVLIAVTILAMSVAATYLSNVGTTIPVEKEISLFKEYEDVRGDFMALFVSSCMDFSHPPTREEVEYVFNVVTNKISVIEHRYGRSVETKLIGIAYYNTTSPPSVYATFDFRLISPRGIIEEDGITYPVWIERG